MIVVRPTGETDILAAIRDGEIALPPLRVGLVSVTPRLETGGGQLRQPGPDASVEVTWNDRTVRFAAELTVQTTPKAFRDSIERIRAAAAAAAETRPLLIAPYLSPERLEELESRGVSGIDLSGNVVVVVLGELLVFRTGNPNRYPAGRRIRNVYAGASSLVARVFLLRPRFETVQAVMDEITARGGQVSLGTVSKVLKVLDEDLVIRRDGRTSELLQPDELLDRLAGAYRPPDSGARRTYRWVGEPVDLTGALAGWGGRLVRTGEASVDRYAVMPREKAVRCYCTSIALLEQRLSGRLESASRFPDLELIETRDPTVYFDSRSKAGVPAAPPIQCWLELQAGDTRQADAAATVQARLTEELRASGWEPR